MYRSPHCFFVNFQSQFGEPCDPVKAPEIIANIIGKMSPQQIQSIINETKRSLQCDPDEARTALVNNPQMAYALLLALVRGRYITKERGTVNFLLDGDEVFIHCCRAGSYGQA